MNFFFYFFYNLQKVFMMKAGAKKRNISFLFTKPMCYYSLFCTIKSSKMRMRRFTDRRKLLLKTTFFANPQSFLAKRKCSTITTVIVASLISWIMSELREIVKMSTVQKQSSWVRNTRTRASLDRNISAVIILSLYALISLLLLYLSDASSEKIEKYKVMHRHQMKRRKTAVACVLCNDSTQYWLSLHAAGQKHWLYKVSVTWPFIH